ncbi:VOC family protein [Microvirga zambiensis]|uniref:VOC family protein n=1 Tax=Microvirga zambiensis TaxID=1402137 RepID=UPI00191E9434
MHLDHIHIYTSDPANVASWFSSNLNGREVWSRQSDDVLRVDVHFPGASLAISAAPPHIDDKKSNGGGAGIDHLGFKVEDVDHTYRELMKRGVESLRPPRTPRLGVRSALIKGPEGIVIEIFHRSANDYNAA